MAGREEASATDVNFLYHVERHDEGGYDTYSGFVVCCASFDEARRTHPGGNSKWLEQPHAKHSPWIAPTDIDKLNVTYLGRAKPCLETGVICESFHAG